MDEIRLENVSKTYVRPARLAFWPVGRGGLAAAIAYWAGLQRTPSATVEEENLQAAQGIPERIRALDNVCLDILDGETLTVIGPSGCGKTTLLRVIAGLERPDSGRVVYDWRDMAGVLPKDRGIGMVFQNYALYPHMSSRDNLAFFLRMHHREKEIDEKVRITAQTLGVGFEALLDKMPKGLSGGQKQRVAIGRCIIRDPTLFLFDEPLSNLDAKLRAQTRVEIKRLLQRFRITSVYVTHDQVEAVALADRIAVMRQGRIEQVGTYWELYERPINHFVAGFLGVPPISVIPCALEGQRAVLPDRQEVRLSEELATRVGRNPSVLLGVRAEQVQVRSLAYVGGLLAEVEVVESLPSERAQLVHLRGRGWNCPALYAVNQGQALKQDPI